MALDFFAGTGESMSKYLDWFDDATYWEIDEEKAKIFDKLRPEANIIIGDSYEMALEDEWEYNLILVENYVGIFGTHCEHFDALNCIPRLISAEGGYVVSQVCTNPKLFLIGQFFKDRWMTREYMNRWFKLREIFYGKNIMRRDELTSHYIVTFNHLGLRLKEVKYMRRCAGLMAVRWKLEWI
jgi:hypothetical protein